MGSGGGMAHHMCKFQANMLRISLLYSMGPFHFQPILSDHVQNLTWSQVGRVELVVEVFIPFPGSDSVPWSNDFFLPGMVKPSGQLVVQSGQFFLHLGAQGIYPVKTLFSSNTKRW